MKTISHGRKTFPRVGASLYAMTSALVTFALFTLLFFGSADPLPAQGWQMFAEQLKTEAAAKRNRQNSKEKRRPPAKTASNVPLPDRSDRVETSPISSLDTGTAESADLTPPTTYPVSPDSPLNDPDNVVAPSEIPSEETAPISSRFSPPSSVSQARLLDFSEDLGETTPSENGPAESRTSAAETNGASISPQAVVSSLPSYRDFPRMKNDATLADLFFPSPSQGWAVGDRGTVWTTLNGGENWLLVSVPTDVNLHSVHFFDEKRGLIVGGSILPGTANGRGVILRTEDGGRNWSIVETASFPILRSVRFFDEHHAEAAGDSSELYPSGLFVSDDGGQTWTSRPKVNRHHGWKTFLSTSPDSKSFGISPDGELQTLASGHCKVSTPGDGSEFLTALTSSGEKFPLWLVGRRGMVMTAEKENGPWKRPAAPLPSFATDYFDFETVSVRGNRIRIAGNPGTRVFLSDDGGQTWRTAPTGITVPITKLWFADDRYGWGIGELGHIIATADGGQTWRVQHEGGRRLAYLGIFADGSEIPYEVIARLSGQDGYLGMTALTTRPESDASRDDEIPRFLRLKESVVEAGGSGVTEFSRFLSPPESLAMSLDRILERFNRENDGKGLEIFRERLVRLIRTYRPAVLLLGDASRNLSPMISIPAPATLTMGDSLNARPSKNLITNSPFNAPIRVPFNIASDSSSENLLDDSPITSAGYQTSSETDAPIRSVAHVGPRVDPIKLAMMAEHTRKLEDAPKDPLRELVEKEVTAAIQRAADPLAYPEHLTLCGLDVWSVEKIQMILKNHRQGNIVITPADYAPALGRSYAEIAENARKIAGLANFDLSNPKALPLRRVDLTTLYDKDAKSQGTAVFAGMTIPFGSESRRTAPTGEIPDADQLSERNSERLRLLEIVRSLASASNDGGRGVEILLSEIERELTNLDPELAVDYLLEIGKTLDARGEWRLTEKVYSIIASNYPGEPSAREALVWLVQFYAGSEPFWRTQEGNRFESRDGPIQQVGFTAGGSKMTDSTEIASRLENADTLGKMIRDLHPELYMDSAVRFPLAVAQRKQGYVKNALSYFLNRSLLMKDDLCGFRAKGEFWLLNRNRSGLSLADQVCPLSACSCRATAKSPYLDGVLEPEVWQNAARFSLSEKRSPLPDLKDSSGRTAESRRQEENEKISTEFGTFVSILYDFDYLYLGIEARKPQGIPYPPSDVPRQRDADLSPSDRVELSLDLDRDFVTFYRFVFDRRGWVTDSCWNRRDWNARIFVAQQENAGNWTLEVAIPWSELTDAAPKRGDVWGIALRRIVPNLGMEVWNADHSVAGQNGFGYLTFGATSIRN